VPKIEVHAGYADIEETEMLKVELDEKTGIAVLTPDSALSEADFAHAALQIDPYIEQSGGLKGLIISAENFPGWKSFGAMIKHFNFVREHQRKITHVAFVTDSAAAGFAENIIEHFVSAEIKVFPFGQLEDAKSWIQST